MIFVGLLSKEHLYLTGCEGASLTFYGEIPTEGARKLVTYFVHLAIYFPHRAPQWRVMPVAEITIIFLPYERCNNVTTATCSWIYQVFQGNSRPIDHSPFFKKRHTPILMFVMGWNLNKQRQKA